MLPLAIAQFLAACFAGFRRPGFALALVVLMFAVKQFLQSTNAWLANTQAGSVTINAAVLTVALLAIAKRATSNEPQSRAIRVNVPWISAVMLFAWSVITCIWTPSDEAWPSVMIGLPYFLLMIVVAPALVSDLEDIGDFQMGLLVLGTTTSLLILVSPDFSSKFGRLGVEIAGVRSNPLALGELGGMLLLSAVLMRRPGAGWLVLRITAAVLGTIIAVRSGSRGQYLYAVIVAIVCYPLAAPLRSFRLFALTVAGIGIFGTASLLLLDILISDPNEARRFSIEAFLYGESSATGRLSNIYALYSAWASDALAPLIGLGYHAFDTLSDSIGQPYSHVLFADAIFELGLPGVVLMSVFVGYSVASARSLLRQSESRPGARPLVALLVGWFAYQVLLVNKQGSLWGAPTLFTAGAIMASLAREARRHDSLRVDA
jgi:hypothetical protein